MLIPNLSNVRCRCNAAASSDTFFFYKAENYLERISLRNGVDERECDLIIAFCGSVECSCGVNLSVVELLTTKPIRSSD